MVASGCRSYRKYIIFSVIHFAPLFYCSQLDGHYTARGAALSMQPSFPLSHSQPPPSYLKKNKTLIRSCEQMQAQAVLNPELNMEVLGMNLNDLWAVDTWEY